jgi:hypothetical protein
MEVIIYFDPALSLGLRVQFRANVFPYPDSNSSSTAAESEFKRINYGIIWNTKNWQYCERINDGT